MPRKYQTPEVLHDAPLHDRKTADFHFDDFAATLARLIASPQTETPLAIGINGAWGSGKTSLLMRVKNMLDKPKGMDGKGLHRFAEGEEKDFRACKTVWFDAWKYNEEKELLVALVRGILLAMGRDGFIGKLKKWMEDPTQPSYDLLGMFLSAFQASFGGLGAEFKIQLDLKKYETPSKFEEHTAFFDYFSEAFERLLAVWVHGKGNYDEIDEGKGALVIFIDDLDRCLPDKTVQTLEALKLFLDKRGCVFVIGADTGIVQKAVETHYQNTGITGQSARDYLEKVIQLRFDLPLILDDAMAKYLRSEAKVDEAMQSRWRALVAAAEVNPRRVKNVINDLNLQWFMAVNSGQAEGVNRDDFICWQALMHAAPAAFARQVMDFEDNAVRCNFVLDALKWQKGTQEEKDTVKGFFSAYDDKDSKRLRGVLRQISFSTDFAPETLAAMIYMAAPPPKPELEKPVVEEPKKTAQAELAGAEVFAEAKEVVMRGERGKIVTPQDGNRLVIGGLEFLRIPKGKFVMGSKDDNELAQDWEKPQHTVDLSDYWMAKFILTNQTFAEFVKATNYRTTAEEKGSGYTYDGKDWKDVKGADWKHPLGPKSDLKDKSDHPVVLASWDDAMAYCKWFNETFKSDLGELLLRLPTEAEWEKAARGAYGNEWPWGNEFDLNKCNSVEGKKGGTTPVGAYSSLGGDSPYGCADMVGNVWEWCADWYDEAEYKKRVSGSVIDPRGPQSGQYRVLRGGSFNYDRSAARCASRYYSSPGLRDYPIGFRVCASSPSHI
jgi:formylglycine-generating enzyme required for sulfatase activity